MNAREGFTPSLDRLHPTRYKVHIDISQVEPRQLDNGRLLLVTDSPCTRRFTMIRHWTRHLVVASLVSAAMATAAFAHHGWGSIRREAPAHRRRHDY